MSTVLVTGAYGLAGHAITAHLASHGHEVIPVSHQQTDLMDPESAYDAFLRPHRPIDYVVHMAARVYGLVGNMQNQAKALYENTLINTNVIHTARRFKVRKIIAMGTNAIYPWPPKLPYKVEDIFEGRPHDGESGYGHAKRHMLATLEAYKSSHGLDFVYLVSGNLYGPNDNFNTETGHVLPSLIKKFYDARQLHGCTYAHGPEVGDVEVWGDGSTTRDFLYTKDLARIVRFMIENPVSGPINIGSGQTVSIEYVCKVLSSVSRLDYSRVHYDVTKPKGRPDCYSDLSHLSALGFKPKWTLYDGLQETYEWYASHQGALRHG